MPRSAEFCADWAVVIPVKPSAHGKSRLTGVDDRAALARAIALDTIEAASRACAVVVVTADAEVAAAARALGARVVDETAPTGLNAAIAAGVDAAGPGHRAAMLGDLPALRPVDLADALRRASALDRAVVPDAEGTGSTLITARAGVAWAAAFGADSLRRHVELGCTVLDAGPSLRRDVDTPDQLAAAARLGLGVRSTALTRHRYPGEEVTPTEEKDGRR
ncbi:2-phospho-L-lactate guanylyltransferase [Microbacterium horticulturae]|uniref:Phosphoenolpyruvate guanylyltransferase n=1 Tax=Microbacterium horticulturae TaxID=3028316 RepID=A0ABY8BVX4_9MICO|nr:2-phospho-L-lactate guanylyltransferase [Microbacterium sp. KACC 23027]WEG08335.1 2-phospho-L-lactate guanylyltransferase [Microbacterium sp. KACC 23027]